MTTKKSNHYINNGDFLKALVDYQEKCRDAKERGVEDPRIPDYIGECFLKIAEHLSRKPNFVSYSFRDEMILDGVENCLMYFRNFDPSKSSNPFAYFTQIIYYAFLRRIMREKKQLYVKYKATEQFGILDEYEMYDSEDMVGMPKQFQMYDNISDFIYNFEENRRKKKEKKNAQLDSFFDMNEQELNDE